MIKKIKNFLKKYKKKTYNEFIECYIRESDYIDYK